MASMNKKKKQQVKKVHGALLTAVLIIMALHGILVA
jgi:hypothetical protein